MSKTAVYCRVSTDDQEKEGTSLQTQRDACLAYCKQKGYEVVRQFSETFSGLTLERPKLNEVRDLIRANYIDKVVVYCLDRLSRDPYHGVILTQELDSHHVTLEAVTETVESSEVGRLINYIRGFASKLEAEKIRERTMRGKLARLKEGKLPHGTGKGIYGYDWNKETGHRTINELETKVVHRIYEMTLQGYSCHKIGLELNSERIKSKSGCLWHPLTIRRILNNETYTGKTYSGVTRRIGRTKVTTKPREEWFLLPDVTPPIIDDETFKRVQESRLKSKQTRPLKQNAAYLLTGFMKCPKCGSLIGGTKLNGKYRYYRCRGSVPTITRDKICNAGYIKADELEEAIWNKIIDMLSNPLTILKTLTDEKHQDPNDVVILLNDQIEKLRKKLKSYPSKEKNLYNLLSNEAVTKDYVLDTVTKLKQERLIDEQQLQDLLNSRNEATQSNRLRLKLSQVSFNKLSELIYDLEWKGFDPIIDPDDEEAPCLEVDDLKKLLERKRNFLESIRLAVVADPQNYQFNITLDGKIISTKDNDELISFNDELKNFEKQHPDISVKDLLDENKPIPEHTLFAEKVNQLKQNLVTIEQTSG